MGKKTVDFTKPGIAKWPRAGTLGRAPAGGDDYTPGSKVQIEQTSSIDYAKEKEARVIFRRCGGNLRDSLRGSER